eukprot:1982373-Rhodomonas_salina.1
METRGISLTETLVCTAQKAREMGTWGIKLQSLEKAREKYTLGKFRSAKFSITNGTMWYSLDVHGTPRPGTMEYRCLVYWKR